MPTKMPHTLAVILAFCLAQYVTGCGVAHSDIQGPRSFALICEEARPVIDRPRIVLGEPLPGLAGYYEVTKGNQVLVFESVEMDSVNVVIDGIQYAVAYDMDGITGLIWTNDAGFRDPDGLGVDSTFAEVKSRHKGPIVLLDYLSRIIDMGNGIVFGFGPSETQAAQQETILDEEKVRIVEFHCIPPAFEEMHDGH